VAVKNGAQPVRNIGGLMLKLVALGLVAALAAIVIGLQIAGPPGAGVVWVQLPPEVTVPLPPLDATAEGDKPAADSQNGKPPADAKGEQVAAGTPANPGAIAGAHSGPVPPDSVPATGPVPIPPALPSTPPPAAKSKPLSPAPDPNLIEKSKDGALLPVIGRDGRQVWQAYARPFDASDQRPRIAIVITGLGIGAAETAAAINQLPGTVTLAFTPHSRRLSEWIDLARAAGHEVLLNLPMEPVDYPRIDPGLNTLLSSLDHAENLQRLNWVLSQTSGYVGVVSYMGSRFETSRDDLKPILEALKSRGLLFVDNRATPQTVVLGIATDLKLPLATNNRFIDSDASRAAIDKRLAELEEIAKKQGVAVGLGNAFPVTIERLAAWAQDLESRGVVLAPVSATVVH